MSIRVRYAPSPTGLQHIGGIRTALFNYLFARSTGGTFILRLEDTDRTRSDPAFEQNLYDTFNWLGIQWDEGPGKEKREEKKNKKEKNEESRSGAYGPYVQSERSDIYKKHARQLLDSGQAYPCFCSAERLEKVRAEREAAKSSETGYDRHCRNMEKSERERRIQAGENHTIRLRIPLEGDEVYSSMLNSQGVNSTDIAVTCFNDKLLGRIEWKNSDINPDPVLLKSDGFPTYHLANVVDDHLMEITHVLRAQEWLSSTPLHIILYKAFGWEPPEFCHLPMVMGPDGKKLSKRHGATSIDEFRRQGYLPQALINYTALLGCSYEDGKDIYTLQELGKLFSIDKLNKAPAVFDYKKLEWYNGQYIRTKTNAELAELSLPFALDQCLFGENEGAPANPTAEQKELYVNAMELVRERAIYLPELPLKLPYLFSDPIMPAKEEFIPKKSDLAAAHTLLNLGKALLPLLFPCGKAASDEEMERIVKETAERENVKLGDLLMPLRVAITGARVSPPLFASIRLLGLDKCMARVEAAVKLCGSK